MSDYVRVYHPTGNAWQDVPKGAADEWKASGWLKTKPKHVDDSGALPAGPTFIAALPADPKPEAPQADKV